MYKCRNVVFTCILSVITYVNVTICRKNIDLLKMYDTFWGGVEVA